ASIVIDNIQPLIGENAVIQRYQAYPPNTIGIEIQQKWTPEYNSNYATNTYGRIMGATGNVFGNYQVGTLIKFSNAGTTVWASIVSVLDNGYYVLSTSVSSNMQAQEYILQYRTRFNSVE
ncbi:hypothetical protein, partial [Escherichia coli]